MRGLALLVAIVALVGGLVFFLALRNDEARGEAVEARTESPEGAGEDDIVELAAAEEPPSTREAIEHAPSASQAVAPTEDGPFAMQVMDPEADEPIVGARVRSIESPNAFDVLTDADGRCELDTTPRDGGVHALVEAEGYMHFRGLVRAYAEPKAFLRRIERAHGIVRDAATGHPVSGATVAFRHVLCSDCEHDTVTTDADGHYEIEIVVVQGRFGLSAGSPDHPLQAANWTKDGERDERGYILDFTLESGTVIRGDVYDFQTGAPLEGVRVDRKGVPGLRAPTTDSRGRFELRKLPDPRQGKLGLVLERQEYCSIYAEVSPEQVAAERLRLPMVRLAQLEGRVVDEAGHAIPGATGSVLWGTVDDEENPSSPLDEYPANVRLTTGRIDRHTFKSDLDGTFTVEGGLHPWSAHEMLTVHAEGYDQMYVDLAPTPPGETLFEEVVLRRKPEMAVVRGHVTMNGEALSADLRWTGPARNGFARTSLNRGYEVEVEPGRVELAVSVSTWIGPSSQPLETVTLDVEAGREYTQDFDLERPVGVISGSVTWDEHRPAAEAKVTGTYPWMMSSSAEVSANGDFTLTMPDYGVPIAVSASAGRSRDVVFDVAIGATGVDLVLATRGTLHLSVLDADSGEVLETPLVLWRRVGSDKDWEASGSSYTQAETLENGALVLDSPSGSIELWVGKPNYGYPVTYSTASVPVDGIGEHSLVIGKVPPTLFEMVDPPRNLQAFVIESPFAEGAVREEESNEWMFAGVVPWLQWDRALSFDEHGRAWLRGLAPGEYQLFVTQQDTVIEPSTFTLGAERNDPVHLSRRQR